LPVMPPSPPNSSGSLWVGGAYAADRGVSTEVQSLLQDGIKAYSKDSHAAEREIRKPEPERVVASVVLGC
jgi:hypothetical protein